MNSKSAPRVRLLLWIAASLFAPALARADGPLSLKGAPTLSPATPTAGKDATLTVEVATSKAPANVVHLQVRLGTQTIGTLNGDTLGANKTGKYTVKIAIPAGASGAVTLSIWGQGVLIGNVTTKIVAAGPTLALENKPMASAVLQPLQPEKRVEQVRSLGVDVSVMAGSSAQVTITLEAPAGPAGTPVGLTSSSPAVTVPQSVRVAAGSTTSTFQAMAVPGGTPGNVTLSAVVAGPGGVAKLATLRVFGVEQVRNLMKDPQECPEGRGGSGTIRPLAPGEDCQLYISLDARAEGGAKVLLTSSRPDVTVPASVAVAPGSLQGGFVARVRPGGSGGSVSITAVTDRPGGVAKQVTLELADPPAGQVTSLLVPPGVVEPGLTYNGTIRLDGPAGPGGVNVILQSASAAVGVPSPVNVPPGASSAGFLARVAPSAPAGDVVLSASRSGSGNAVVATTLKVRVIQVAEVKFDSETSGKGTLFIGGSSGASVTLDASPITDVIVKLSSSNAAAAVVASVTIPAGQTKAVFSVSSAPGAQPGDATISAVRSGPGHISKERLLGIKVNQVRTVLFTPPDVRWQSKAHDPEHSEAPLPTPGRVTLEAPAAAGGVAVTLATNTPVYGVSVPASVTVPAGQSFVAFTATVGTDLKQGGDSGNWSTVPVTAVRTGQPSSETKTGNLRVQWNWTR